MFTLSGLAPSWVPLLASGALSWLSSCVTAAVAKKTTESSFAYARIVAIGAVPNIFIAAIAETIMPLLPHILATRTPFCQTVLMIIVTHRLEVEIV